MTKPYLKTICVDFDGVLHSYTSGWKGMGVVPDPPTDGAMQWLHDQSSCFKIAIYSSRSKSLRGRWAMKRWIKSHLRAYFIANPPKMIAETDNPFWTDAEMAYDLANCIFRSISWPWFKPAAFMTIDDRALQFRGEFPTKLQIEEFKPWRANQ